MKWFIFIVVIMVGAIVNAILPSDWMYIWGFFIGSICLTVLKYNGRKNNNE